MFVDIQCAVKDSKDMNRFFVAHQVGNTIMTVEDYADVFVWILLIAMTGLWELAQRLNAIINPKNDIPGRFFIVAGNVVVDFLEPVFRLVGPFYFRH